MSEIKPSNSAEQSGADRVEAIREDLACPDCEYNLRGLSGDVVTCPECGRVCDVAALVTARWTGKWYKAPGLNTMLIPTAVAVVGGLIWLTTSVSFVIRDPYQAGSVIWSWAILGITLAVWLWRMAVTSRAFDRPVKGPALAMLAHALFVGYLGGLVFFVSGLASFLFGLFETGASGVGMGLLMIGGSVAVIWGCRWGEKFIAGYCIREYLRRQSRVENDA